jgi:hypothetical protein
LFEGGLENRADVLEPMAKACRGLLKPVIEEDALSDGGSIEWKNVRELFVNETDVFTQ